MNISSQMTVCHLKQSCGSGMDLKERWTTSNVHQEILTNGWTPPTTDCSCYWNSLVMDPSNFIRRFSQKDEHLLSWLFAAQNSLCGVSAPLSKQLPPSWSDLMAMFDEKGNWTSPSERINWSNEIDDCEYNQSQMICQMQQISREGEERGYLNTFKNLLKWTNSFVGDLAPHRLTCRQQIKSRDSWEN